MDYDFKKLEDKWRTRWDDEKVFESNPDDREKFYITVAYPYPSGGIHVGHARTYTVPDVFARYKRMRGYNVLYPMGWHVTGTPIVGAVKRMKEGEEKQLSVLKNVYSMTDEDMAKINEPMDYARYFIDNHYIPSMRRLGYLIDWRRQFTTNDPRYNKFITWQYKTLHERGLVKEGKHPVRYCTGCKNPVTAHDLLEGEDSEIQEWTLLKFAFPGSQSSVSGSESSEDPRPKTQDCFLIAATLRPETIYGQTNMWVNPESYYVKADVDGECWIISEECVEKLKYQDKKVETVEKISGKELVGKYCRAPGIDRDIIILPSSFCDPKVATGLVTSVPSDAPFDWAALRDIQNNEEYCKEFDLDCDAIRKLKPIPIIKTKKFGENAGVKLVEEFGIQSQDDAEKLEAATKEVYKEGFHTGIMLETCGKYAGLPVERAKESMKQDLIGSGVADIMNEFSAPVVCRCGGKAVVADADSWFLAYSNDEWKTMTGGLVANLTCIPENTKNEYYHTIGWLKDWPCVRNFGLGTRLPFDDRFIVEPLSDSTIYMSYYTISHLLKEIDSEKLTKEFFDFIFRGIGSIDEVSEKTGIEKDKITKIKESFDYWYPLDWRCSASELIGNHLTFMLFHHTALFPGNKWPKGIVAFGMGLLEGAKMSSSKGNVVLLKDALERHGADVVRLFLMSNAEPWQDFDWREKEVVGAQKALSRFVSFAESISQKEATDTSSIDIWLLSRLQEIKRTVTHSLENLQTRKALQAGFFEVFSDIRWYERRGGKNKKTLSLFLEEWIRMLAPFTPYLCEELWVTLGKSGFIADADYPLCDESKIDQFSEAGENMIKNLIADVEKIVEMTGKKPSKIHLFTSEEWKYELFEKICSGAQIKDIMSDDKFKRHGKEIVSLFKKSKDSEFMSGWGKEEDLRVLDEASDFLASEFSCTVIVDPEEDPNGKRRFAIPAKPAIYLE